MNLTHLELYVLKRITDQLFQIDGQLPTKKRDEHLYQSNLSNSAGDFLN